MSQLETADGTAGIGDQGVSLLQGMTTEENTSIPSVWPHRSIGPAKKPPISNHIKNILRNDLLYNFKYSTGKVSGMLPTYFSLNSSSWQLNPCSHAKRGNKKKTRKRNISSRHRVSLQTLQMPV